MRCDILTLFPDMVAPVLGQSILKRAQEKGLLHVHVQQLARLHARPPQGGRRCALWRRGRDGDEG